MNSKKQKDLGVSDKLFTMVFHYSTCYERKGQGNVDKNTRENQCSTVEITLEKALQAKFEFIICYEAQKVNLNHSIIAILSPKLNTFINV